MDRLAGLRLRCHGRRRRHGSRPHLQRQEEGDGSAVRVERHVGPTADDGHTLETRQRDRHRDADVGADPQQAFGRRQRRHFDGTRVLAGAQHALHVRRHVNVLQVAERLRVVQADGAAVA